MGIEYMLYFYGAVCCSMIVFNVVYALILRGSEPRLEKRIQNLTAIVSRQLEHLERGEPIESGHLERLWRKLRHTKNLIAFDRVLRALSQEESPSFQAYLSELQPCLLYLAFVYRKRENTQAAYYSYFLSRYIRKRHLPVQTMQEILLDYVAKNNLYCRVNALQALYTFGSTDYILEALKLQDQGTVFVHEKILTEGLLTFTGDHDQLISRLWRERKTFSVHTQLAILNYIRFRTDGYVREMFSVMQDPEEDKELRLAAIRYFGRYHYQPALEPLLRFAGDEAPDHWEYATVGVSSLAHYPDPRAIEVLKQALHSSNWYIRYAAAVSLESLDINYEDLMDIVAGEDRYAREMMTYRMESRRMQKAGV